MTSMLSRIFWRWSPIVSGLRIPQMSHQSASLRFFMDTQSVTSNIARNENDVLIASIKSAKNSNELLSVISRNANHLSAEETLTALTTLFEYQKNTTTSISHKSIVNDTNFERLCRSLKKNARHMELNDVINSLKIVSYIGAKSGSEITLSLLYLIKDRINDVTLAHIVFLNNLLSRMESHPLIEALKISMPVLLQIQIGTKIDYENITQLTELLQFTCKHRVSDQCIMNIVNSLILHGDELSLEQSRSILWSLSHRSFRIYNANCEKLLENAMRAMKRDIHREDFLSLNTTLDKMVNKYLDDSNKFVKFYDEALFNKCGDFVVANDLGFVNATYLYKNLNKIRFVSVNVLNYMIQEVDKYPRLLVEGNATNIMSLITALVHGNCTSDNLRNIKSLLLESNFLTKNHRLDMPWHRLSAELLCLGIECPSIWDIAFSNDFVKLHLAKDKHRFMLRTLELYQFLKVLTDFNVDEKIDKNLFIDARTKLSSAEGNHQLQTCLEAAFGGSSFVFTNVHTELGHLLDYVIAFDKSTLEPVRIEGDRFNVLYNDISVDNATKQYVAVISFPQKFYSINMPILRRTFVLRLQSLEKMGISVVALNYSQWCKLLDEEKIPYIQREVKLKLTQLQDVSLRRQ